MQSPARPFVYGCDDFDCMATRSVPNVDTPVGSLHILFFTLGTKREEPACSHASPLSPSPSLSRSRSSRREPPLSPPKRGRPGATARP